MTATKSFNLQDAFLNQLRKEKVPVTMYLTNGVRLRGSIKAFDNFVILMKDARLQLIYKHAVSSIIPDDDMVFKPEPTTETTTEKS
ncbi:Host factor Hfq [Candidatus Magnetobacterium bavaricum]|uniref:RNA-binding protein Hfq n=1 Tax=Candidatus Magnetobacterium bavaricum TaxID=29290 RepID=A0A0F3GSM3_9BACT|nr:Host factor Hfq [Candidatus Magnetobacterium bavaricum]